VSSSRTESSIGHRQRYGRPSNRRFTNTRVCWAHATINSLPHDSRSRKYLIDALYSPNTGLTSRDTEEIVESMENIDHEGSLVFLLRMCDKWDDRHTKKSTRLKYYKSVSRFFFRQFLMNMQRYDEVVDLAPSKDILMTDMVYLQLNGDLQDFATRKGSPDVNGPNLNGGKVWIAQLLQLRVMFRLLRRGLWRSDTRRT
jgi:hypothetical protein